MKSTRSSAYQTFLRLLIEARKACDMTQAQLAQKLRQPQSYVSKVESGERRLDVIEFLEIAHALEIKPAALIAKLERAST